MCQSERQATVWSHDVLCAYFDLNDTKNNPDNIEWFGKISFADLQSKKKIIISKKKSLSIFHYSQ